MSKLDGRKVSHSLREAIRIEAIQKWIDGETVQNLSKEYGTDTSCIYRWRGCCKSPFLAILTGVHFLSTGPEGPMWNFTIQAAFKPNKL